MYVSVSFVQYISQLFCTPFLTTFTLSVRACVWISYRILWWGDKFSREKSLTYMYRTLTKEDPWVTLGSDWGVHGQILTP